MRERVVDRTGFVWAELAWDGDRLARLVVPGATLDGTRIDDPLLGTANRVGPTTISVIDWARPTEIPAIAAPGALPPGAGGAILNVLAQLAHDAGTTLRYAGPYPTPALYRALLRSFRTTATEDDFTRDVWQRAARLAREPIAIDFAPAPHDRIRIAGGHVELRDGVERVRLDGIEYARDGSPARLVVAEAGGRCEIWFGDAPYAHVATVAADGALVAGPHAIPPSTSRVLGAAFPPPLAEAIAELVAELAPAPLATDVRTFVATTPIVWADLGARAARVHDGRIEVHAALWDRLGPLGLARLALALAEAICPVAVVRVTASVMSI